MISRDDNGDPIVDARKTSDANQTNTGKSGLGGGSGNNSGNITTPAPNGDKTTSPADDWTRFADVLGSLFGQQVVLPSPGEPQVVPTQTTTHSAIPVVLIVGGIAVVGYMIYKNKGGS